MPSKIPLGQVILHVRKKNVGHHAIFHAEKHWERPNTLKKSKTFFLGTLRHMSAK